MLCPKCRAEYRPGFTRCSDCDVELVEELPPVDPQDPKLDINGRPDRAPTRVFLAWFLPMCIYLILFFGTWFRPVLFRNAFFALFLVSLVLVGNIGAFWMMYQAVRYERQVGKYVLPAFIPFMFVWYSIVRVPLRRLSESNSEFIR
jgi:hypothetical protein